MLLKPWIQSGQFNEDDVRINAKVVVFAGKIEIAGIGRETALDLSKRGAKCIWHVVI